MNRYGREVGGVEAKEKTRGKRFNIKERKNNKKKRRGGE